MIPLEDLTKEAFDKLRDSGMLWEFYPEAPDSWYNIPGNKPTDENECKEGLSDPYAVVAKVLADEIDKEIMDKLVSAHYNKYQDNTLDLNGHMKIVKEIELINVADGHNKIWIGELYDNNTVITRWGKIGYDLQSSMFPSVGERFLEQKIKEKKRKGYIENYI